jgi:hypothetical protein
MGLSEEDAKKMWGDPTHFFADSAKPKLNKIKERFEAKEVPKAFLFFHGDSANLLLLELYFHWISAVTSNKLNSVTMYDIVDAYFNDPNFTRKCFDAKIVLLVLGTEVQNTAAVKVMASSALAYNRRNIYPAFLTKKSKEELIAEYPTEFKTFVESEKAQFMRL